MSVRSDQFDDASEALVVQRQRRLTRTLDARDGDERRPRLNPQRVAARPDVENAAFERDGLREKRDAHPVGKRAEVFRAFPCPQHNRRDAVEAIGARVQKAAACWRKGQGCDEPASQVPEERRTDDRLLIPRP